MANVKGLVLAAGFGTRLRPLTNEFPKPLVPIFGLNPLGLAVGQLQAAGISDLAVNTHYQADKIADFVLALPGPKIHISHEEEILGTGGAYNPLRAWLGDSHLAVINGDIVCSLDIGAVVERHLSSAALATMALLPAVLQGESGVHHSGGAICGIGAIGKKGAFSGNFACVQVLSPAFFQHLPASGSFDIISSAYRSILDQNLKLSAYEFSGIWHDIRTPDFYFAALADLANKWGEAEMSGIRNCLAKAGIRYDQTRSSAAPNAPIIVRGAHVSEGVVLGTEVFIEANASVGRGAILERAAILPGGTVAEGSLVKNKIIGKNFSVDLT